MNVGGRNLLFLFILLFLFHLGSLFLFPLLPEGAYPLLGTFSFGLGAILLLAEKRKTRRKLLPVERVADSVRAFKHDFANHVQVICGLAQSGSLEALREYTLSLVEEIKELPAFFDTGNAPLNALLHAKLAAAEAKKIGFRVEVHCPVLVGRKESYLLVRILGNIIDNALEALGSAKNPQIAVSINRIGRFYHIAVENNGPPIPEAERRLIFERGYSTKGGAERRGLGLYIARRLLQQIGGGIRVTSTESKTRFLIQIPGNETGCEDNRPLHPAAGEKENPFPRKQTEPGRLKNTNFME